MKESFWEKFTQTGRVEDYLSYIGMEICQNIMEKHREERDETGKTDPDRERLQG